MVSRREVVKTLGLAGAAALLPGCAVSNLQSTPSSESKRLYFKNLDADLTKEDLEQLIDYSQEEYYKIGISFDRPEIIPVDYNPSLGGLDVVVLYSESLKDNFFAGEVLAREKKFSRWKGVIDIPYDFTTVAGRLIVLIPSSPVGFEGEKSADLKKLNWDEKKERLKYTTVHEIGHAFGAAHVLDPHIPNDPRQMRPLKGPYFLGKPKSLREVRFHNRNLEKMIDFRRRVESGLYTPEEIVDLRVDSLKDSITFTVSST